MGVGVCVCVGVGVCGCLGGGVCGCLGGGGGCGGGVFGWGCVVYICII